MILVDELREYTLEFVATGVRVHGCRWCHMISDGDAEELHRFAKRIGLHRSYFHRDHYDLTPGMRTKALKRGAVSITGEELVDILRKRRGEQLELF